jgi:peptide/nickel transport system substrate-binding protein
MKMISSFQAVAFGALLASIVAATAGAAPKQGIAMHGEPALAADFKNLPYANPDAPQGGTLKQAISGTFDSISPFIVKGNAAYKHMFLKA